MNCYILQDHKRLTYITVAHETLQERLISTVLDLKSFLKNCKLVECPKTKVSENADKHSSSQ